eukprot:RCo027315
MSTWRALSSLNISGLSARAGGRSFRAIASRDTIFFPAAFFLRGPDSTLFIKSTARDPIPGIPGVLVMIVSLLRRAEAAGPATSSSPEAPSSSHGNTKQASFPISVYVAGELLHKLTHRVVGEISLREPGAERRPGASLRLSKFLGNKPTPFVVQLELLLQHKAGEPGTVVHHWPLGDSEVTELALILKEAIPQLLRWDLLAL